MTDPRIAREQRTIKLMLEIYCRGNHGTKDDLCRDCSQLLAYSRERLDKCPFKQNKPTCQKCTIHCYQADRRRQIKAVMRYAGPRILFKNPFLAIAHGVDAVRSKM